MNFSAISNRTGLGKALRLPLQLIPHGTTVPILQGALRGKKWIVGSSTHGCWLGSYEHDKRLEFERMIRRDQIVFDIGANVGFYTLLASTLVGPNGRVYSFEPLPGNITYLYKHLRLNGITNVWVKELAISDRSGVANFMVAASNSMGSLSEAGGLEVETMALDDLISQGGIPVPDVIKIDVEGAELLVLSGAEKTLKQSLPTLFLATHGSIVQKQCCDLLDSIGYEIRPIVAIKSLENSDELVAVPQTK